MENYFYYLSESIDKYLHSITIMTHFLSYEILESSFKIKHFVKNIEVTNTGYKARSKFFILFFGSIMVSVLKKKTHNYFGFFKKISAL